MRWKRKVAAAIMTMALSAIQFVPVYAAEQVDISFKSSEWKDQKFTVSCVMEGKTDVTNGKLRIKYHPEELVLVKTEPGKAVSETLTQANDCLEGNKEPGEIVFVFAGAKPVKAEGALAQLTFQAGEKFDSKSGAEIEVSVEEFACDGTPVSTKVQNGAVGIVKDQNGSDENNGNNNTGDNNDGNNNNGQNGNDNQNGNGNGGGDGSTAQGGGQDGNAQSGGQSLPVKTGDKAPLAIPLAAGAASVLVIAGVLVYQRKK